AGDSDAAEKIAQRITTLAPGHVHAEQQQVDAKLNRDRDEAIAHVEHLLAAAGDEQAKRTLRLLLGRTFDRAGQPDAAAATWAELHAEVVGQRLPLPPVSDLEGDWPESATLEQPAPAVLLLWCAPGSFVERLATVLDANGAPLRA